MHKNENLGAGIVLQGRQAQQGQGVGRVFATVTKIRLRLKFVT